MGSRNENTRPKSVVFFLRPAFAGRMSRLRGSSMPQIPGGQAPKPAAEPQEQHQQGPATRG
jgi:hypothetical protein